MFTPLWMCGRYHNVLYMMIMQSVGCIHISGDAEDFRNVSGRIVDAVEVWWEASTVHGIVVPKELERVLIFTSLAMSVGVVVVEIRWCRWCAVLLLLLRKLEAAWMAMFIAISYELWKYVAVIMVATIGTWFLSITIQSWNIYTLGESEVISIWYTDRQNMNWGRRIW